MSATVSFDVGGTVYKVSRSLLERHPDTMLARMASETWRAKSDNNKSAAIFIERDPEFFRYVLSYMRDGQAFLPASRVSKDAILQELQYFGFQNVNPASLKVACVTKDSIDHLKAISDKFKELVEEHRRHTQTFEHYGASLKVAVSIFSKYRTSGELFVYVESNENKRIIAQHGTGLLNEFLQMFGVRCTELTDYGFTLERLSDTDNLPSMAVVHPMARSTTSDGR